MESRASPPSYPAPKKCGVAFSNSVKIIQMGLLDFIFPKRCVACEDSGSYLCDEGQKKVKGAKRAWVLL